MKNLFSIFIFLVLNASLGLAQVPEFSELSGNGSFFSELTKSQGSYYLLNSFFEPEYDVKIYKLSEDAMVEDSISLRELGWIFIGTIGTVDDRLHLCGLKSNLISNYSQRYTTVEFDENLEMVRMYESDILDTLLTPLVNGNFTDGTYSRLFDFTVFEDSIYTLGRYLFVDTMSNIIGGGLEYFKANFDGNTYLRQPFPSEIMFNVFFRGNTMYYQGSNLDPDLPGVPFAVGAYDGAGQFIEGWNFDQFESGEVPWGACGGTIDDRLYFSYLGRDPSLPGCPDQTVVIDIRDTAFQILHRFKIDECDYRYAGEMPFAKGVDESIYFQAAHADYKKFLVKKYSPEMELIWTREYDFSSNPFFTIPQKLVPTEDGGVIAHCREQLNGVYFVRLYKISANGDIVSSTGFGKVGTPAPNVLFPNPCRDRVQYNGEHTGELYANIYSFGGRLVKKAIFSNNELDLSGIQTGLYSVQIIDVKNKQLLHQQTIVKVD